MHPSGADGCCDGNHRFEFQKRSQDFIRVHNETLSVVAVCVSNPNRSPVPLSIRAALARRGTAQRQRERGPRGT